MRAPNDGGSGRRTPGHDPGPAHEKHVLQFFEKDDFAADAVADFLEQGLASGGSVAVFATPDHGQAIVSALAARGRQDLSEDRLKVCDANEMLSRVLVDGMPDPVLLRAAVLHAVGTGAPGQFRWFYGEMGDLLRLQGNMAAALHLEDLWQEILHEVSEQTIALVCGVTIDPFLDEPNSDAMYELCRRHAGVYTPPTD